MRSGSELRYVCGGSVFREEVGWSCSMVREDYVFVKSLKYGRVMVKCVVVDCFDLMFLNKLRGKGKRRVKKILFDIFNGYLLYDWCVNKLFFWKFFLLFFCKVLFLDLKCVVDIDWVVDNDEIEDNGSDDGIMEFVGWVFLFFFLFDIVKKYI